MQWCSGAAAGAAAASQVEQWEKGVRASWVVSQAKLKLFFPERERERERGETGTAPLHHCTRVMVVSSIILLLTNIIALKATYITPPFSQKGAHPRPSLYRNPDGC